MMILDNQDFLSREVYQFEGQFYKGEASSGDYHDVSGNFLIDKISSSPAPIENDWDVKLLP
jgi:hypothetical protein